MRPVVAHRPGSTADVNSGRTGPVVMLVSCDRRSARRTRAASFFSSAARLAIHRLEPVDAIVGLGKVAKYAMSRYASGAQCSAVRSARSGREWASISSAPHAQQPLEIDQIAKNVQTFPPKFFYQNKSQHSQ